MLGFINNGCPTCTRFDCILFAIIGLNDGSLGSVMAGSELCEVELLDLFLGWTSDTIL